MVTRNPSGGSLRKAHRVANATTTRLLTLPETAEALRKSQAQLRWMIQTKTAPPSAKIGGRRMWREDELARWIDTQFSDHESA